MSTPSDFKGCSPGEWPASEADAKKGHESDRTIPTSQPSPHQSCLGMGEREAGSGREAPAPASAALPCQNSNNSAKPRYKLIQKSEGTFTDRAGKHVWNEMEDGSLLRHGRATGAEARSAFHLRLNIAAFIEYWGRNHCLFFTITDQANLHPTQFARRWNNYLRRQGLWIVSFIKVLEPQLRGAPHYHILVAVLWETCPDAFDWAAYTDCQKERKINGRTVLFRQLRGRYRASAAPKLVAMWSPLREALKKYGLGRGELLPLRKCQEAVSAYIGKYLEAGLTIRKHEWKGCRRVEFDRRNKTKWLTCTRVFAWHSPGAAAWRKRVGELGVALKVDDMDSLRKKMGPKWAYHFRESITFANDSDWHDLLHLLKNHLLL